MRDDSTPANVMREEYPIMWAQSTNRPSIPGEAARRHDAKRIADYTPVLSLLSTARLSSVPGTFNIQNDNIEMYGFSLWVQNAAASLYPLVQQLELILRNSIDKAARSRFGDKWWNVIKFDTTKDNHSKFRDCIKEAEKSLKKSWRDRETARQGLAHHSLLTTPPPVFSHDDIIATTNFSTWESVFLDALHTENNAEKADYLWPNLGHRYTNGLSCALSTVLVDIMCASTHEERQKLQKKSLRKLLYYVGSRYETRFQACVAARFVYDLLYTYTDKLCLLRTSENCIFFHQTNQSNYLYTEHFARLASLAPLTII